MNKELKKKCLRLIEEFEGFSRKVYKCTEDKNTIGYGLNMDSMDLKSFNEILNTNFRTRALAVKFYRDNYITNVQGKLIALHYIEEGYKSLKKNYWITKETPEFIKLVLLDLVFNMGIGKLNKFVKFKKNIKNNDIIEAVEELKDSIYYTQVKNRANKLIEILLNGGI